MTSWTALRTAAPVFVLLLGFNLVVDLVGGDLDADALGDALQVSGVTAAVIAAVISVQRSMPGRSSTRPARGSAVAPLVLTVSLGAAVWWLVVGLLLAEETWVRSLVSSLATGVFVAGVVAAAYWWETRRGRTAER